MGVPQIIVIVLYSIGLLSSARMHGQAAEGKYNFWIRLLKVAIMDALLIWGRFFN